MAPPPMRVATALVPVGTTAAAAAGTAKQEAGGKKRRLLEDEDDDEAMVVDPQPSAELIAQLIKERDDALAELALLKKASPPPPAKQPLHQPQPQPPLSSIHHRPQGTRTPTARAVGEALKTIARTSESPASIEPVSTGDGGWSLPSVQEQVQLLKERSMDALQEGITIADFTQHDHPLIYCNQGFVRLTGFSVGDTLGHNCRFLQGEGTDPAAVAELSHAIREGRSCCVELLNYRKSGEPFVNLLSLTPIHDSDGRLTHYVGIQSDITELVSRKHACDVATHVARIASAATEAKSRFLATMSHEIRTPLNGIISVSQLLAESPLTPMQKDLVNTICTSGETLLALITDILDFSRIEANKLVLNYEPFDLRAVVEAAVDVAGLQAGKKRVQLAYYVHPLVPTRVRGDPNRLQQILLNMLNNGIKFTEHGAVLLEVWCRPVTKQAANANANATTANANDGAPSHPYPGVAVPSTSADLQRVINATNSAAAAAAINPAATNSAAAAAVINPAAATNSAAAAPATTSASVSAQSGSFDQVQHANSQLLNITSAPETSTHQDLDSVFEVTFVVRDTGIGISKEGLGRLFISFSQVDSSPTRRYGGTGLGLAISRRLCEGMGGQMWADSKGIGLGSTFGCRLPLACLDNDTAAKTAAAAAAAAKTTTPLPPPEGPSREASKSAAWLRCTGPHPGLCGKTALVYDRCQTIRHILRALLREWGMEVYCVSEMGECMTALGLERRDVVHNPLANNNAAPARPALAAAAAPPPPPHTRRHLYLSQSLPAGEIRDDPANDPSCRPPPNLKVDVLICEADAELVAAVKARGIAAVTSAWPDDLGGTGGMKEGSGMRSETSGGCVPTTKPIRNVVLRLALLKALGLPVLPKPGSKLPPPPSDGGKATPRTSEQATAAAETSKATADKPAAAPAVANVGEADNNAADRRKLRVLLAEDNKINTKVALNVLNRLGHKNVTVAEDGLQVLDVLAKSPNGPGDFDVLLMDLHMPNMGGVEATEQILSKYPSATLPIVAVTADAFEDSKEKCMRVGFRDWLSKPFRVEQVHELLERLCVRAPA